LLYFKYKKNKAILDYVSVNPEYISAGLGMTLIEYIFTKTILMI